MDIILATKSPCRVDSVKLTGFPFETKAPNLDENFEGRPKEPENLVKHLSELKAKDVAKNYENAFVIGFDSVGYFNGKILEKPESSEEAFERLKSLSGNKHSFYTGITLINTEKGKTYQEVVSTEAVFGNITEDEIKKYLTEDRRFNTYALGYDPLEFSKSEFIEEIIGDAIHLLMGTPVQKVEEMIIQAQNDLKED